MAILLIVALKNIITKFENMTHHFVLNDNGNVLTWDEHINPDGQIACFDCKRRQFLYVQVWTTCKFWTTTVCLNPSRSASRVCYVLFHTGSISQTFGKGDMTSLTISLKELEQKFLLDEHPLHVGRTTSRR